MFILGFSIFVAISTWKNVAACNHYDDAACIVMDPLEGRHFLNQWIVNVEGGPEKAQNVARELGFEYMKKVRLKISFKRKYCPIRIWFAFHASQMPTHDDHYFFRHPTDVPHRHKMKHKDVLEKLKSHKDVSLFIFRAYLLASYLYCTCKRSHDK